MVSLADRFQLQFSLKIKHIIYNQENIIKTISCEVMAKKYVYEVHF